MLVHQNERFGHKGQVLCCHRALSGVRGGASGRGAGYMFSEAGETSIGGLTLVLPLFGGGGGELRKSCGQKMYAIK